MGHQIVKQPNGKFAVWSSVVDSFILIDATPDEIVEDYVEKEADRIRDRIETVISQLNSGQKPYHQLTHTFDDCVAIIRELHGDNDEALQLLGIAKGKPDE